VKEDAKEEEQMTAYREPCQATHKDNETTIKTETKKSTREREREREREKAKR
jgi:hypothetical protein